MNELTPFKCDLDEADRLFKAAHRMALDGDRIGADDCLERGLDIIDMVEAKVLAARGVA